MLTFGAGPSVTITPMLTPTTTTSVGNGGALVDWYTAAPTITLTTDTAGGSAAGKTYYASDNPDCSYFTSGCQVYSGPFSVGAGLHTLTYRTVNALGLEEAMQTHTFAVTRTSAAVTAASVGTGTVGAAVYGANPAGAPVFNSSGPRAAELPRWQGQGRDR